MRNISWLVVGLGSALFWSSFALAQDAQRPVQVIVGPNGIKVIDPRTGKELPSVVTRVPHAAPRIQIELDLEKKQPGGLQFDLQLDAAHKELIRAIQLHKGDKGEHKGEHKFEIHQLELKIVPGPDGKARVIALQGPRAKEPGAGLSTDKKLDLLLKEMNEMRRDMHEIKQKLGAGGGGRTWGGPWGGPGGFEWKWNAKDEKGKKGNNQQQKGNRDEGNNQQQEKGKKDTRKGPAKQGPTDRDSDIERRFERILQEAEELRRELRKLKAPGKE